MTDARRTFQPDLSVVSFSKRNCIQRTVRSVLLRFAVIFLLAVCIRPATVQAQSTNGTVTGTVLDPSGRVVPGVQILLTDTQRGISFKDVTNSSGLYQLSLPIGTYTVQVQKNGFDTIRQPAFELELGQTDRLDFTLKVGATSEVVVVGANEAPLLKTENGQLDSVIDDKTTTNLPLATRNYVQLTLLIPGSTHPDPTSMTTVQSQQTAGRPFINGNNEQSNNFLLDGLENNQLSDNLIGYSPSVDAIQEFTVITQNPSAEYGNFEGGTITTAIKSGTNKFHGNIFEFIRNDVLNASPWGDGNTPGSTKPTVRWNMFGGTIGGPILHNKLFFFADYQAQHYDIPTASALATVLSDKMRHGDFSEILPGNGTFSDSPSLRLYDPSTSVGSNGQRALLPNNNLANIAHPTPAFSGIDPVATAFFASGLYPEPTFTGHLNNNYLYSTRSSTDVDQGDIKLDYALSEKDHIFARASKSYTSNPTENSFALIPDTFSNGWTDSGIGGWTHQISPTFLNDLRFGVNYTKINYGSSMTGLGNLAENLGISNGNSNSGSNVPGLPLLEFGSIFTHVGSKNATALFADTSLQADDGVTVIHGRHTFHTGFQFRRYRINTFFSGNNGENGYLDYTGVWTSGTGKNNSKTGLGYGAADFLYGAPANLGRGADNGTWGQRATILAGYVQDDWKISKNVTLNLGLRYDNHLPWVEVNDKAVNFDLQTGQPIYPAGGKQAAVLNPIYSAYNPIDSSNRATYNSYNTGWDFQPRVGFAWNPDLLANKAVLRGAYGVTSYLQGTGTNLRITENVPFVNNFSSSFTQNNGVSPSDPSQTNPSTGGYHTTGNGFPGLLTPSLSDAELRIWDPDIKPAVDNMWNLSIQYQLSNHDTAQAAYVGQKVTRILVPMNYAQFEEDAEGNALPGPFLGQIANNNSSAPSIFQVPNFPANNQGAYAAGTAAVGNQGYNALQATYQHRFDKGLEAQFSYTYSKCMADNIGYYGNSHGQSVPNGYYRQDQYNQKAEWGPCYYDVTHIFTGYVIYNLPFGHNGLVGRSWNGATNTVLGDWQVSVITTDHTGYAMTAIDWNPYPNSYGNSPLGMPRADCLGAVHYTHSFTSAGGGGMQFWDNTNFSDPQSPTQYGTCSNGTIRGPGLATADMSLQKNFNLGEVAHLQFRAEAINVLNHPIFTAPDTAYSDSTFGVTSGVGAAEGERQLQFALKLSF
jgi:Carboxypeptidase regulatory-like domain